MCFSLPNIHPLTNISKSSQSLDGSSFPWRSTVIYAACAQTLFEHYINIRQTKRSRRSLPANAEDAPPKILSDVNYYVWNAFHRFLLVLALVGSEAVPKLWTFVRGVQETRLPPLYDSDWGRSYLFLVACYCMYPVLNIPHFLYRVFVSGEGVLSYFVSRRKRNSLVYAHIAEGRPVATVIVLTAMGTLYYKIFEKKLDGSFVLWVAGFQAVFAILRPILSQPRSKSLDIMWDGETRDAIHELATTAGFPVKEIYVVEGDLDSVHNGVKTWGWPRKTYITVHKDVMEQCTTDDITALLAQELGSWKHGNGVRLFSVGQVPHLSHASNFITDSTSRCSSPKYHASCYSSSSNHPSTNPSASTTNTPWSEP